MTRSSRHRSHKQSKHSSKDYSDSEEDVKMKEKSSKDENQVRIHRDSASGEKRKTSSQVREGKESKDLSGHGNGELTEEYASSKRRKEKSDISVVGGRWNGGGGEEKGDADKSVDKEINERETLKLESKLKDSSNKGESLRTESKSKSKRYEGGSAGERKEDGLSSVVIDKEESKSKVESKRKSERDSSTKKEGRDSKDKDRRLEKVKNSEKEKNEDQEHKRGDADMKTVEVDTGKKPVPQSGDFIEERQGKRTRENTERSAQDGLEKDIEKKICRKREDSSEREKHHSDSRVGDERRISSRSERSKDITYKDDRHKTGSYTDKYQDDSHRDERQKDEKYREEADKDHKHRYDKYREDSEKDSRCRDDRHREDGDRDKPKGDKHREDGEKDSKRKDDKHRQGVERESRNKDDRHHEKHREDNDKYIRRSDEKYHDGGERDDRRKDNNNREYGDKDNKRKEEKFQEAERDYHYKDSKQSDDFDREKRQRDSKYRDEHTTKDYPGEKSDPKRPRDDGYPADHYSRKLSAYDDSPTHDERSARYRDEPGRRRPIEKEDYDDTRSRGTKDQRSDTEKRSASNARINSVSDKGRSSSRNADLDLTSGHSRRRSSPNPSSHVPRDYFRAPKQDDSKYRDYNFEERVRHNVTSNKGYAGGTGGSEKALSSRSLEKLGPKDDGHTGEFSAERNPKPDIRASPLHLVDKSPSSSIDKRQLSRSDVKRSTDVEESAQRSGSSRDVKEYSGKEGRGSQELALDAPPGDDFSQVDVDTTSVSSPYRRNSHFSSRTKTLPLPPPFRSGVDSPSLVGYSEDDSRGKANNRPRRPGDPNMGRMPGNAWRGVPSWPSPANGFLPFPHASPPVSFHSVIQPFHTPPIFGVRPPMDITSPYHMPDADRFSGPGRPMGWRNQVDPWDGSSVFVDGTHIYGRPDWDHSRNIPGGRGWEPSGDLWKGPSSRTVSSERQSSEKENNPTQSVDETLAEFSTQPAQSEQTRVDQQADSTEISQSSKSYEKNDVDAPVISLEETTDVKMSAKDDARFCDVYLSKLDISADLAEPGIYNQCTGMIGVYQSMFFDVDDAKILYMEEAAEGVESALATHKVQSYTNDSVFQKAMALYKKQKESASAEGGKNFVPSANEIIPNIDLGDQTIEEEMTDPCKMNDMQGVEDAPIDAVLDPPNNLPKVEGCEENLQEKIDPAVFASLTENPKECASALDGVDMETSPVLDVLLPLPEPVEEEKSLPLNIVERSDAPLLSEEKDPCVESGGSGEELKLLDSKCCPLLNSDVSSEVEAMMPGSIMSGSVNLSRIHHSPESTH